MRPSLPTTLARTLAAACATGALALSLAACASQPASEAGTDSSLGALVAAGSAPAEGGATYEELLAQRTEKGTIDEGWINGTGAAGQGGAISDTYAGPTLKAQDAAPAHPTAKPWTVMVYIVGTNLESDGGQATADMNEMRAAGVDFDQANVLCLTGGAYSWAADVPNNRNVVWDLATNEAVALSGPSNMGEPSTLADFINFADRYYPAEHTALVFWDHGGGPILGFGSDELAEGDGLSLPEMAQALQATRYHDGTRLDVVGFDACLMGSLEIADVWKDYADWLVASEEVEAGIGWNWSYLATLNDSPDPLQLCKAIVSTFEAAHKLFHVLGAESDYTLSAMELSKVPAVTAAVDELAASLEFDVDAGDYTKINQARVGTTQFGVQTVRDTVVCYDLFDLAGFASQFSSSLPAEAGKVTATVDDLVAAQVSNIAGTRGVSIYFPASNQDLWELSTSLMGTPLGNAYRTLTANYAKRWEQELGISWTLSELDLSKAPAEAALSPDGTEYLVPLSDEQVESLDTASYSVLAFQDGSYRRVLRDVALTPDDEGVLHVPVDPGVPVLTMPDAEAPLALAAQQVSLGAGRTRLVCPDIRLFAAPQDGDEATDPVAVSLILDVADDGSLTLVGAPLTQESVAASRATAQLSDYQALSSILGYGYTPTRDEAGDLLPHSQWEQAADSDYTYGWAELGDSLAFALRPASDLGFDVACQVVFTDQAGTAHATELFELGAGATAQ